MIIAGFTLIEMLLVLLVHLYR
ncbi:prepilin-type N-terminal cleavage/methylation domain-containing protein [Enterococcus sp. JM4C]